MTDTHTLNTLADATPLIARHLRTAGAAASAAVLGILANPVLVMAWEAVSPIDVDNPLVRHDPVTWMHLWGLGILYGVAFGVVGVATAVLVVTVRAVLAGGPAADFGMLAGAVPVACWLITAGSTSAAYSSTVLDPIVRVSGDPAVRSMVGFAGLLSTQGLLGAAGIGLVCWAVAVVRSGRRALALGWFFVVVVGLASVGILIAVLGGAGGLAAVLAAPIYLAFAVALFRRSRRLRIDARSIQSQ